MEIPFDLKRAVEERIESLDKRNLARDAKNISEKYRSGGANGKYVISTSGEADAYPIVRMPATYCAVYSALAYSLDICGIRPESLLDIGSGTGAAAWAALSQLELKSVICFERDENMSRIGDALMKAAPLPEDAAHWIKGDILSDEPPVNAELVTASYVFNEMAEEHRSAALLKLWRAAGKLLLIVEPGTPAGYGVISAARELLLKNGGHIAAPCTHENRCPMNGANWCHFACRVPRGKTHRELKGGSAPYEDEKYSYIAFVKDNVHRDGEARILRHPYIEKGCVSVEICTAMGLEKRIIRKKDGAMYKNARKAGWGGCLGKLDNDSDN